MFPRNICPHARGLSAAALNVASCQNGIGTGVWQRVNGFSEALVNWIAVQEAEFG
jgi:hypothetical protein